MVDSMLLRWKGIISVRSAKKQSPTNLNHRTNQPLRVHIHPAEAVTATIAPQKDPSSVAGQRNTARHFGTWHASWFGWGSEVLKQNRLGSWSMFKSLILGGWCFRHPAFTSWRFGCLSHYFQGFLYIPVWCRISSPPKQCCLSHLEL